MLHKKRIKNVSVKNVCILKDPYVDTTFDFLLAWNKTRDTMNSQLWCMDTTRRKHGQCIYHFLHPRFSVVNQYSRSHQHGVVNLK